MSPLKVKYKLRLRKVQVYLVLILSLANILDFVNCVGSNNISQELTELEKQLARVLRAHAETLPITTPCATVTLENSPEPAITLFENRLVNRTEFENIQVDKLKNAKFSVGQHTQNPNNCRLKICGFSESKNDWGECPLYSGNATAPNALYGKDYEVTSIGCACSKKAAPIACDYAICNTEYYKKTWRDNECAVMYQENGCQSCYFQPIILHNDTSLNTSNSFAIQSAITRPECQLRKTYTGIFWWDDYPGSANFTGIADTTEPSYHKDGENFYCICPSINLTPTTTTNPPTTIISSTTDKTESVEEPETTSLLVLWIVGPMITFGIVLLIIGFVLKRKHFQNKKKAPEPPPRKLETLDTAQIREEIANEIYRIAKLLRVSNESESNSYLVVLENTAPVGNNQVNAQFDKVKKRFEEICRAEHMVLRKSILVSHASLENPLGSGMFGIVYKGLLEMDDGLKEAVAVKKIKWQGADPVVVESFLRELQMFQAAGVEHKHIVKFLGACCHPEGLYLLTEYCSGGSLREVLLSKFRPRYEAKEISEVPDFVVQINVNYVEVDTKAQQKWLDTNQEGNKKDKLLEEKDLHQILSWCEQIASGMDFLRRKGIVHADLAARNILISENNQVKICDLGLSRKCLNDNSAAQSLISGNFPLNSYAPELICDGPKQVTLYVDIWAYGFTLWELFTLGDSLYPTVTVQGPEKIMVIKELVKQKYRHPKPRFAQDNVYGMMLECWNEEPHSRPSFENLYNFFKQVRHELCEYDTDNK